MTSARARRYGGRALLVAMTALAATSGVASAATPLDLYYERSVMAAADARCGLFTPSLRFALTSAQAQARGAALRAGTDEAALARALATARAKAGSVACSGPDLAVASGRVRQAFDGYSRLQRMTFSGDAAAWEAQRPVSQTTWTWRLSQTAAFGPDRATLGLAAQGPEQPLVAVAGFADGAWPYAARLVMRDPRRAPAPSAVRLRRGSRLDGRTPPRSGADIVLARDRSLAEPLLLPTGFRKGVQFRFPPEVIDSLQALDPREAIAIEFLFSSSKGDQVRTAYFEVGDFTAATAFLKLASR